MEFQDKGQPFREEDMAEICESLRVNPPEVWAVLTVETRGFGYLPDRRPQILFERHIFHKRTGGRFDAADPNISNPDSGGYVGGAGEYPRLQAAMGLDRNAGLKSASWGLGQVMGFNHEVAGFATVDEMVEAMVRDERAQLLAVANFLRGTGLDGALRRRDWEAFAKGYNGPKFKENEYDTRLAAADAKFTASIPDLRLRTAQAALLYLGIDPGPVDGQRGKRTRAALTRFQENHGLPAGGELDEGTEAALLAEAFPA